jgi:hypothetical protein
VANPKYVYDTLTSESSDSVLKDLNYLFGKEKMFPVVSPLSKVLGDVVKFKRALVQSSMKFENCFFKKVTTNINQIIFLKTIRSWRRLGYK